ncbi:helix-turn-helix transcriptional regulator [Microbacterium maritypicum]|uniref:Helix-turn-helix transcriptional regulator n=1 Tax=Microbacterium maritypicum TaxID=33918 RepID=A0AAD3X5Y1_MICMQ|nr:helix-turn-helix transcriptional regulator [Microbacterium liquefaciens]KAB1887095.1 helix-turn-helix transcriptional regulator [Microbacterium liquefaciens]
MLARLADDLDADAATIREVVQRLTPDQRHGLRPAPTPLPLVPAIAQRFEGVAFDERDRRLLLALAVCLDDALDPILEFDGRSAAEVTSARVGAHLAVHAGRMRFIDARLAIWLRAATSAAETAAVHGRLSAVFRRRGERVSADWHRARASLEAEPTAAPELTLIARELSEAGYPDRALLLAREACEHAVGEDQDEARLVAGASAVGAGFAAEAAAWLGALYPHGTERYRLAGLGALIVAQTVVQGAVPEVDPTSLRPETSDADDWHHWTRAAALAAILCAERGDRRGMRTWLDALRDGASRIGSEHELRDPVVALSWLLVGDRDIEEVAGSGPVSGGMLRTLRAAVEGDVDLALRLIATDESALSGEPDPFVPGYEHSPVVQAYRAVVEVLLLVWRGDIGVARDRLIQAALSLPIAVPFAGLGVVLARRLDLAVLGELGPFARSLTVALPGGAKIDLLVDRGIQSFLAGSFDDAAATVRLWSDLGGPQTTMAVPGLDELAFISAGRTTTEASIEPPEIALAQHLRVRVATAGDGRWRAESDEVRDIARTLTSPFARARVETMLGTQHAIRDDHSSARIHLQYAERLFELSGATAWARAVRGRLDRLDAREGSIVSSVGALSACRAAWSPQLTARELEVAMRAVGGAANREISEALNVSVRTVEVHLGRVFTKLGVRSRVELTVLAHRTEQHL